MDGVHLLYFQTPTLPDGTHTIKIMVTAANSTNPFTLDYITIVPILGTYSYNPSATPSSASITPTAITPVGAIVGGVVGGIAGIAILAIAVYYFLRGRIRGRQDDYLEKPDVDGAFPGECPYRFLDYLTKNIWNLFEFV